MSAARPLQARAERTRFAILEAAERHFAAKGFTDTRLEDIANDIGIRQPGIFYYFKDKRALYETVLENLLAELAVRVRKAVEGPRSALARIEAAVEALVEHFSARPALVRFILRETANPDPTTTPGVFSRANEALFQLVPSLFAEGVRNGEFEAEGFDPYQFASAIGGTAIFYNAMITRLIPGLGFDPASTEAQAHHKTAVLRIARVLLGVPPDSVLTDLDL